MEKKKRNRKQLISTEGYINRLFLENSKLNIARFDLGYKKPFSNEITLEDANKDINKMLNFLTENWPTILKTFDPPVN